IERRQVRAVVVVCALERRPIRVQHKRREADKDQDRLNPPPIRACRFTEFSLLERERDSGHANGSVAGFRRRSGIYSILHHMLSILGFDFRPASYRARARTQGFSRFPGRNAESEVNRLRPYDSRFVCATTSDLQSKARMARMGPKV